MTADGALIFTQADWRTLDSLKIRNLSVLKGITDDMSKDILRELSDGINAGESIPKLTKRIQDVAGVTRARAERIARTESVNAAVDACRVRYEQAGVTEFEYIAASDDRLCAICASYNGKIYKLTDNEHLPPIHPNCRCAIAPVIGDRDELLKQQKEKEAAEAAAKQKAKEEQEAAAAAAKAKEKAKAEELKKLKAEKKKAEAEAAKAKAEEEAAKKKAEEELKKAKEEKEAAERKAREAEAAKEKAEHKVKKSEPLLSLVRGSKKPPVVEYPEFKSIGKVANKVKEPNRITSAMMDYTGSAYRSINQYLRRKPGWQSTMAEQGTTAEEVTKKIKEIDEVLSDKTIAPKIEMLGGDVRDVPYIFRGLKGDTAKGVVEEYLKYLKRGERVEGVDMAPDEGFASWSIDKETAQDFARKGEVIASNGIKYQVVLAEQVTKGTPGYYIGGASSVTYEEEVLRPRGLINVIDSIKYEKLKSGALRLVVNTHLKRIE